MADRILFKEATHRPVFLNDHDVIKSGWEIQTWDRRDGEDPRWSPLTFRFYEGESPKAIAEREEATWVK